MSAAPNEYHDDAKTRAMVREAAERAGLRITDYSIKDAAGKRTISVGFATRPEVVPDWVHELQASLMEFAHIPLHLNREYRRQRWLRVSVSEADIDYDFCLNVKEAMKLADVLDYFIHQPNREGGGE